MNLLDVVKLTTTRQITRTLGLSCLSDSVRGRWVFKLGDSEIQYVILSAVDTIK